jgi:hypothetical protein
VLLRFASNRYPLLGFGHYKEVERKPNNCDGRIEFGDQIAKGGVVRASFNKKVCAVASPEQHDFHEARLNVFRIEGG